MNCDPAGKVGGRVKVGEEVVVKIGVELGVTPVERSAPGSVIMEEARKRDLSMETHITIGD